MLDRSIPRDVGERGLGERCTHFLTRPVKIGLGGVRRDVEPVSDSGKAEAFLAMQPDNGRESGWQRLDRGVQLLSLLLLLCLLFWEWRGIQQRRENRGTLLFIALL